MQLSTLGLRLSQAQRRLLNIAMPRGLGTGVLSALPLQYGIAGAVHLSSGMFATIVFSIVIFAIGFAVVTRSQAAESPAP